MLGNYQEKPNIDVSLGSSCKPDKKLLQPELLFVISALEIFFLFFNKKKIW